MKWKSGFDWRPFVSPLCFVSPHFMIPKLSIRSFTNPHDKYGLPLFPIDIPVCPTIFCFLFGPPIHFLNHDLQPCKLHPPFHLFLNTSKMWTLVFDYWSR